jgi:hypothetical protein
VTGNILFGVAGTANVVNVNSSNILVGTGTGGTVSGANLMSANFLTGTLTTAAQPNITSIGTLTSLSVSGNSTLGSNANLKISGGSANFVLSTDGASNLSWVVQSGGGNASNIANGTSNVSIPAVNGNILFGVAGTANVINVNTSNVILGTGTGGNLTGANVISANTFTGTTLSITGVSTLGPPANVKISGGTANYVLSTDGASNLSWVASGGTGSHYLNTYLDGTRNIATANATWILNTNNSNNAISYNTTTGALSLTGGKIYRITTIVNQYSTAAGSGGQETLIFSWYETASATEINAAGRGRMTSTLNGGSVATWSPTSPTSDWIYSPVSNTTIRLATLSTQTYSWNLLYASLVVTEIK